MRVATTGKIGDHPTEEQVASNSSLVASDVSLAPTRESFGARSSFAALRGLLSPLSPSLLHHLRQALSAVRGEAVPFPRRSVLQSARHTVSRVLAALPWAHARHRLTRTAASRERDAIEIAMDGRPHERVHLRRRAGRYTFGIDKPRPGQFGDVLWRAETSCRSLR
jgi:hypothetical protein